jgi:IclR family pca regulon transcriptional regulator
MTDVEGPREHVQSLTRGLAVIRSFDREHPQMTLSDVARSCGLARASARRFLHTLVTLGYVRTDGRMFALTPKVLELGFAYLSGLTLPELAQPHLEDLAGKVNESTSVSVLDGDEIVYVARVATSRIMSVRISIGTRFPAHATSMGRVLLAGLPEDRLTAYFARTRLTALTPSTLTTEPDLRAALRDCRSAGWTSVDQELEEGLRSVAVPIRGSDGAVIAAVNVAMPSSRYGVDSVRTMLLAPLLETAHRIQADLRTVRRAGRLD